MRVLSYPETESLQIVWIYLCISNNRGGGGKVCNEGYTYTKKINIPVGMFPAYLPPLTYTHTHQNQNNGAKYLRG